MTCSVKTNSAKFFTTKNLGIISLFPEIFSFDVKLHEYYLLSVYDSGYLFQNALQGIQERSVISSVAIHLLVVIVEKNVVISQKGVAVSFETSI